MFNVMLLPFVPFFLLHFKWKNGESSSGTMSNVIGEAWDVSVSVSSIPGAAIPEHRHPMRRFFLRIKNIRVSGVAVMKIENEVRCNLGAVPNRERDLSLNFYLKLDCLHCGNM